MLNVDNEVPVRGKTGFGGHNPNSPVVTLGPEEIKMYKDCISGSYVKSGIPFALFCHFLSSWRNPVEGPVPPKVYLKRGLWFFGNVLLGSIFYTPVCYFRLLDFHREQEKLKETATQGPFINEETQPTSQQDEFSYPTDMLSSLDSAESTLSSDFSSSQFMIEDEKVPKARTTTYEDLRAQNRSRHNSKISPPASSLNFDSLSTPISSPTEKPVPTEEQTPKMVIRNKYGDVIE